MSQELEKLSKSARRRRRKRLQQAQQPAATPVADDEPDADINSSPDNTRMMAVEMAARHWAVFDWWVGGKSASPEIQFQAVSQIVRSFLVSKMPDYRDAKGQRSGSVRAHSFDPEA